MLGRVSSHERAIGWAAEQLRRGRRLRELAGGLTSTMLALTTRDGGSAVLRLMTNEPWRTHGEGLTTRERDDPAVAGRHHDPGAAVDRARRRRRAHRATRPT